MKRHSSIVLWISGWLLVLTVASLAEQSDPLEKVLQSMDAHAASFHTAQANFVWTPYNGVVKEEETPDKGKIYFRRSGKDIQMAAYLSPPDEKQIVFAGGKIQVYQPKMGTLDVYDAGTHREEFETFLVLGFGSSGQDLRKSFEVTYLGEEKVGTVETAKLKLTPLASNVKDRFPRIDLWIDPQRGLSVRQQLFQSDGDYRMADYSDIQVNQNFPNNVFKLKTTGKTKTVTH